MPTYQYVCTECGEPLEAVQSFTDDALTTCPVCGGQLRKVFSAVGVVFKGSGFYRNDSRTPAGAKSASSSSSESTSSSSDSSSSDSKGDSANEEVVRRQAVLGRLVVHGQAGGHAGQAQRLRLRRLSCQAFRAAQRTYRLTGAEVRAVDDGGASGFGG